MEAVRKDMARSKFPLGINKAPMNWGTPGRGKLSADIWRVVCTIHLVITLIRVWGYEGQTVSRQKAMLVNFLDLVNAMLMAANRTSSDAHADSFDAHCYRYLEKSQLIYRDFKVKPLQHVGQHFGHFLRTMGPSHAFRTPGFERMNYYMQRTNTNNHQGTFPSDQVVFYITERSV
ncbi:hypothetical protein BDZ89DRAFT_968770 [Hymenopellis radicata]|nr:hypothetical protein BDZ89DRAFT_968770 [Hymenopellis radicata]